MSLLNAGGGGADLQLGREHDVGLLNRLFVNEIERHAGCRIIDTVVANTQKIPDFLYSGVTGSNRKIK